MNVQLLLFQISLFGIILALIFLCRHMDASTDKILVTIRKLHKDLDLGPNVLKVSLKDYSKKPVVESEEVNTLATGRADLTRQEIIEVYTFIPPKKWRSFFNNDRFNGLSEARVPKAPDNPLDIRNKTLKYNLDRVDAWLSKRGLHGGF